MQRRESYVEMNINAYDDTNATIDIDDADRVSGGDERRIALTHSIRILLTVLVIPFYFKFFEGYVPGGLQSLGSFVDIKIRDGLLLAACTLGFPLFVIRCPNVTTPKSELMGAIPKLSTSLCLKSNCLELNLQYMPLQR